MIHHLIILSLTIFPSTVTPFLIAGMGRIARRLSIQHTQVHHPDGTSEVSHKPFVLRCVVANVSIMINKWFRYHMNQNLSLMDWMFKVPGTPTSIVMPVAWTIQNRIGQNKHINIFLGFFHSNPFLVEHLSMVMLIGVLMAYSMCATIASIAISPREPTRRQLFGKVTNLEKVGW